MRSKSVTPQTKLYEKMTMGNCHPACTTEKPVRKCCLIGCNNNAWQGISDYCEHHTVGNDSEPREPCENCHLAPIYCEGLTLKDACVKISELKKALTQIASQPLEPAHIYEIADRIKLIAKAALEI